MPEQNVNHSHNSFQHPSQYLPQQDNSKASFDYLIDEDTPYSANVHKVYTVQPPSSDYRRPSYPLDPMQSYSSEATAKISEETTSNTPRTYPPGLASKNVDSRGFWKTVGIFTLFLIDFRNSRGTRYCLNQWLVDSMSLPCSFKQRWTWPSRAICLSASTKLEYQATTIKCLFI